MAKECRIQAPAHRVIGPVQGRLFPPIEHPQEHEIRARWRHLVEERLPAVALERNWSTTADHCFARILLDVTLGRPWRASVDPPAWRHTPIDRLELAIALGEALLDRSRDIDDLNDISLTLRRSHRAAATADVQQLTFGPLGV